MVFLMIDRNFLAHVYAECKPNHNLENVHLLYSNEATLPTQTSKSVNPMDIESRLRHPSDKSWHTLTHKYVSA